jgi:hypothetical protein
MSEEVCGGFPPQQADRKAVCRITQAQRRYQLLKHTFCVIESSLCLFSVTGPLVATDIGPSNTYGKCPPGMWIVPAVGSSRDPRSSHPHPRGPAKLVESQRELNLTSYNLLDRYEHVPLARHQRLRVCCRANGARSSCVFTNQRHESVCHAR